MECLELILQTILNDIQSKTLAVFSIELGMISIILTISIFLVTRKTSVLKFNTILDCLRLVRSIDTLTMLSLKEYKTETQKIATELLFQSSTMFTLKCKKEGLILSQISKDIIDDLMKSSSVDELNSTMRIDKYQKDIRKIL